MIVLTLLVLDVHKAQYVARNGGACRLEVATVVVDGNAYRLCAAPSALGGQRVASVECEHRAGLNRVAPQVIADPCAFLLAPAEVGKIVAASHAHVVGLEADFLLAHDHAHSEPFITSGVWKHSCLVDHSACESNGTGLFWTCSRTDASDLQRLDRDAGDHNGAEDLAGHCGIPWPSIDARWMQILKPGP